MGTGQDSVSDRRAHTDASLGAERASTDAASARREPQAQRVLDDLIERDRNVADERLLKFREHADWILERERNARPPRTPSMIIERRVADEDKKSEREITDALLEGERHRNDAAVQTERRGQDDDRARLHARRQDTDDQLSTERDDADAATHKHDETTLALADANTARGRCNDVLGTVTHDLRNPLCIIAVNAQWIAEDTKDVSTREAAEQVSLAAARMGRLLNDLLDVARVESGALRIAKSENDVGALVGELRRAYRPLFAERRMSFVVENPAVALGASFDHDRIVQVLSNLLANAMKFTLPGGTVRLVVERRAEAGEIEFVLSDDGPGIHPDALPHVFKRFWQLDSDTRRGLGLGLYISEEIVKAHGGRIWVESELGKGATFRFTLPTPAPLRLPRPSGGAPQLHHLAPRRER
ncbi:MAG: hypothetical protein JWM82_3443 [Myxococcales bacterium]|nr:hypothetical protein [Myxococcales bacterium]